MNPSNPATLLIATSNPGKLREFTDLESLGFRLQNLRDVNLESPEETGRTLRENAVLKARFGAEATGLLTIADDSGLVVPRLDGAPGVRSARFAGESATDAQNRNKLAAALADIGVTASPAYFVCVLAIVQPDGTLDVVEGTCHGVVIADERGANGFGYDSMFQLDNGPTIAELTAPQKHAISHRAVALRAAVPILRKIRESEATRMSGVPR